MRLVLAERDASGHRAGSGNAWRWAGRLRGRCFGCGLDPLSCDAVGLLPGGAGGELLPALRAQAGYMVRCGMSEGYPQRGATS